MNKRITLFLISTLFSYFGDMLAVMSIPILLFKRQGSLVAASYFTILAIFSALIISRPAATLLRRFHPLKLIFLADVTACLFLVLLGLYGDRASLNLPIFLTMCFVAALAINFPMFAKSQLLYQYFVDASDLAAISSVQGKLVGFVFILSVLVVGTLFDSVGFRGVILFDVFSYVPLLILCWSCRNNSTLGYTPLNSATSQTLASFNDQQKVKILLYYFFNGNTYYFATLRSHLLLTVLVSIYSKAFLWKICFFVALGTLASLLWDKSTSEVLGGTFVRSVTTMVVGTTLIGLTLQSGSSVVVAAFVGFLITEINAISLKNQRQAQVAISSYYPVSRMATFAMVSGSLVSALLIPATMKTLETVGAATTFASLAVVLTLLSLLLVRRLPAVVFGILLLFCHLVPSSQADEFKYQTVMLDQPRVFFNLGVNTMSEDERFVMNNIYCGLFNVDIDKGITPELVSSWSVEKDGTRYRFKIKQGIVDSEGSAINAKYVFDSISNSIKQSVRNNLWKNPTNDIKGYMQLVGFESCTRQSCTPAGLRLENDEIVIDLKQRWPNFLELLARHMMPIYRIKRLIDGSELPISCGPYKIGKYSRVGLELLKNATSPLGKDTDSPQSFGLEFHGPEDAVKGFCSGKYNDLIFLIPTKKDLEAAGCKFDNFLWKEVDTAGYWGINLGSKRLLRNRKLYERLAAALNPDSFRSTWGISSTRQLSTIPAVFGTPQQTLSSKAASIPNPSAGSTFPGEVLIRYIDGTPDPDRLAQAVAMWMAKAKVRFKLLPTPFTEFTTDLYKGNSDVYIYAELATSKLENFLAPLYEMNSKHYSGAALQHLRSTWDDYLDTGSQSSLYELDKLFLASKRFVPLFIFRRPLVFRRGYYIHKHSELGLATLPISEFRRGDPQ